MNFVIVSLQRINTDRDSTSTSLAKELAKKHKVLYVNSPIDRGTLMSLEKDPYTQAHIDGIHSKADPLQQLSENLWAFNPETIIESINWIPYTPVFSIANKINNRRFAADIRKVVDRLDMKAFVLINDKDMFRSFYLKELLKPVKYVYLDRDKTLAVDYWKKHGTKLEPALMKKSDVVVCNSYEFVERAKLYNQNSFYIGNGFNVEQYSSALGWAEPDELKSIPHPRIGYVGALFSIRLDIPLLISIAKKKPEYSFVFIGWEDENFRKSELHGMSNVYFLGKRHTREVPAYLAYFDVCINPQLLNHITHANFPLKAVEYLAMGKPVVAAATDTMEAVFGGQYYPARTSGAFLEQIEKALVEDSAAAQEQRKDFAQQFSWEQVADLLLQSIGVAEDSK
jgi:glycosyltransferase involved in cell wall biosynthesis